MKLKANKKIRNAKIQSHKMRNNITEELSNKLSSIKTSSDDLTNKIKLKFSEKSILNKRLIEAFPNVKFFDTKKKIQNK